jgi:hypothetical protein
MNAAPFARVLWKEYRAQRPAWFAIAATIVVFNLGLLVNPWITHDERVPALFAVGFVLAALYTLGSSVTLFATERENQTYDFLRTLPVGPWTVFFGKVVFALVSAAAMYGFAWTLALILAGRLPEHREEVVVCFGCGLMAVEFLAWGILFSLLSRRTIVAAVLAGAGGALGVGCFSAHGSTSQVLVGPLLFAFLAAANLALAARWLRERRLPHLADIRWVLRGGMHGLGTHTGPLGRLLSQQLRRPALLIVVVLIVPAMFALTFSTAIGHDQKWFDSIRLPGLVMVAFYVLYFVANCSPMILGSTLFLGDQTGHRFRFLAERGMSPRLVWLSRQIRGLGVVLLWLLLLPTFLWLAGPLPAREVEYLLGYIVAAYTCGQLCSMIFQSGILAVAFGAILTVVVCIWANLVQKFGMSWLWTTGPLLLSFLLATWLHAPNWLLERKTWRAWLRPVLAIALSAAAIMGAIPLVRIYEIPWVNPGFDPKELSWPISLEEKETLVLYQQAYALFVEYQQKWLNVDDKKLTPSEKQARQDDRAKLVAMALKASDRPLQGFYVAPRDTLIPSLELELANLVSYLGWDALPKDGKLDAELDRYLAAMRITLHIRQRSPWNWDAGEEEAYVCKCLTQWAAQRGQNSERVLNAIHALDKLWHTPPTYCDKIEYDYRQVLRILEDRGDDDVGLPNAAGLANFVKLGRWLPWERVRALRILNMLAADQIARVRAAEEVSAAGSSLPQRLFDDRVRGLTKDTVTYQVVQDNMPPYSLVQLLATENCRRATRLVLALEAWKLDHEGRLPDSLDELLGKYIDRMPVDPATGQTFGYEPKGADYRGGDVSRSLYIEAGQPYVGDWPMRNLEDAMTYRNNKRYPWFSRGWTMPIP